MATIRAKRIKGKTYYYLEHRYRVGSKAKSINKYLGPHSPSDGDSLILQAEMASLREQYLPLFASIKKAHALEWNALPKSARERFLDHFMVEFIFNSNRIEGSRLSYRDTSDLFSHQVSPKNKPIKDIKEAEGYKRAFHSMLLQRALTKKTILHWHALIFKESDPQIAGKLRLHRIEVAGSSASFPHAEDVAGLFGDFIRWHNSAKSRLSAVEFAALAHLKLVSIHPFSDGNGRISRLVMNHALYHAGYPPLTIRHQERLAYYHALEKSQTWKRDTDFLRFFFRRYLKSHRAYLKKGRF